jgi:hypothetical protein
MAPDFKSQYKTINEDHFPPRVELSFVDGKERQTLVYEKITWTIAGETSSSSSRGNFWPPMSSSCNRASTRARSTSPTPTARFPF